MNWEIILSIAASIAIVIQYLRDVYGEASMAKKCYSLLILGFALILFWGGFFLQKRSSNTQSAKIDTLLVQRFQDSLQINNLSLNVVELKTQNDSLVEMTTTIHTTLNKTSRNIDRGFDENEFYLKNIREKVGSSKRFISEAQRQSIIQAIKQIGGDFTVLLQCAQSRPLNCDYARQIRGILTEGGIKTKMSLLIGGYSNNTDLNGIVFIVNDPKKYLQEFNIIYNAFLSAKLEVTAGIDTNSNDNFVIYIGD